MFLYRFLLLKNKKVYFSYVFMKNKNLEKFINENPYPYTMKEKELIKEKKFFDSLPDDKYEDKEESCDDAYINRNV